MDLREIPDKVTRTCACELMERETRLQDARDDQELWENEDWYPPLCPPTRLKKEILRDEDFSYVDSRARTAPDSLKQSFKEVIGYLTKDLQSDLHKLRAIFMWMGAQNVGTREVTEICTDVDSPRYYLRETLSDGSFIAKLFAKLCRGAGIPCLLVDGKAKSAVYETGDDKIDVNATWAVVYVKDSWRFVFSDWAFVETEEYQKENWMLIEKSGQPSRQRLTESAGIVIADVDEFWFLTDPDAMNCFCHPCDDDKQLLTRTWTEMEFYSLHHYTQDYFSSGWSLLSPTQCIIKANRGLCEIEFQPPTENDKLNYKLLFNEKHSGSRLPENIQGERYVSCKKDGGQRVSLQIRLPVNGTYNLEVAGVHGSEAHGLVKFRIDCDFVPPDTHPFPSNPKTGFGYSETALEAGLSEPSHTERRVLVRPGQEVDFNFKEQKDINVSARLVHTTRIPEKFFDEAVFDFDTPGHQDPILSEKIETTKAKYKQRLEERDSTRERQLDPLDNVTMDALRVNLKSGDTEAVKRKLIQLCKNEVQKCLEEGKLTDLRETLDMVTHTNVGELVERETWFQNARSICEEIDVLKNVNEAVRSVLEEETADLRNPEKVLDVMFAAAVLLGESQEELNTWQHICRKMYQLLARMESFEESKGTQDQVEVATERLERHDWTSDDGTVAKRLYTWCMDKIKLFQQRKKEKQPC